MAQQRRRWRQGLGPLRYSVDIPAPRHEHRLFLVEGERARASNRD